MNDEQQEKVRESNQFLLEVCVACMRTYDVWNDCEVLDRSGQLCVVRSLVVWAGQLCGVQVYVPE